MTKGIVLGVVVSACYTNAPANRDVQASWRGRSQAEIVGRWGAPVAHEGAAQIWAYHRTHIDLPSADVNVEQHPVVAVVPGAVLRTNVVEVSGEFHPGAIVKTTYEAAAVIEPSGTITDVQGAALNWGPPNDVNLHWGTIFGAHVGMGRLDTTGTPLPSGGAYIGGMIGPTLGLVGTYSLAFGLGNGGGAMGMAGGMAVQWWPENRFWLRAGPALLLVLDPGFDNARFEPGATFGASYALVKVGTFALDARVDVNAGTSSTFGTVDIGVNLN